MSSFLLTRATAPATPPAGKIIIYAKADGRMYWKDETGTEYPFRPVGSGSGDLLADGSIPLTANWDVGPWQITALRFHSDEPTLSPFTVVSTAVVTNLNADTVDGLHAAAFAVAAQGALADTALQPEDIDTVAELNALLSDGPVATEAYVDAAVVGLFEDKGNYDASTNTPDLDVAPSGVKKGDVYTTSVAGTFFTAAVEVGDVLRALQDDPTTLAHWAIVQTNLDAASVKTLYESNADTNAFTDAEQSKLAGIEAAADVTDATNVAAAGAVMDGDFSANGFMRRTGAGTYDVITGAQVNVQSGTTYTIVAGDIDKIIVTTSGSDIAITLPDGLGVGFQFTVLRAGGGIPTVTRSGSDTVNGAGTGIGVNTQYTGKYFLKYNTGVWLATG